MKRLSSHPTHGKLGLSLLFLIALILAACDKVGSSTSTVAPPSQTVNSQVVGSTQGLSPNQIENSLIGSAVQSTNLNLPVAESAPTVSVIKKSIDGAGTAPVFNLPEGITSDGSNLYVVDSENNTIRKIVMTTGLVTTLAGTGTNGCLDAIGIEASFKRPYGIATDGANLYVTDSGNNKVRKIIIATGKVTTLAGSGASGSLDGAGTKASFANLSGLTIDKGNLYVADTWNNKIRKIVIATGAVSTLAGSGGADSLDGTGKKASFNQPSDITTDGSSLYVVDSYNQTIRKIETANGKVTTLAGSGERSHENGKGIAASFFYPSGITTDGTNLYVGDAQNHMIRKIVIASGEVTTFAGTGSIGLVDGAGSTALFNYPSGITTVGNNLYVADSVNNRIRKIAIPDQKVTTLAGSGPAYTSPAPAPGADSDSPPASPPDPCSIVSSGTADDATTLFNPHGITSYGGNLYVTDDVNHKIYKTVIATSKMSTLAGSGEVYIEEGEEGYDGTIKLDGKGTEATFGEPEGIIANGKNLYIADTSNNRIRKIVIATGVVTTLAGSGTQGSDDHTGTEASFSQPTGITTDGSNLYVTDMRNQKIRKVVIATGMVTTFAGTGTIGDIDGTGKAASFNFPQAITTDGTNLFVADTNNNKIRKIVIATGVVSTVAGSGVAGSLDGKGSEASFQNALGITTDGHHIYVADTNNHRIRKISIATGEVTTLAGSKIRGFNDGNGTSATFNYPRGITINGSNLYVADYFNHTLRKIVIDTGEVSTLAGAEK